MTTRTAAEALEKLIRLERNLEKKCHDLGYYNMIHVGLREFVEHAETFRAALAPPQPLTDAQIVEIRDDHLPSQGEPFDCIAFARAILNASSHEHVYCPHCRPCKHSERVDAYDGVLRGLASYLSAGGFNSTGLIDPEVADAKIRWGIDNFVKVEVDRLLRATQSNGHSPVNAEGPLELGPQPAPGFHFDARGVLVANAAPPPAPAQEPVASIRYPSEIMWNCDSSKPPSGWITCYSAPPPDEARKLLDEAILYVRGDAESGYEDAVQLHERIRAYLEKHK